jgi:hypothetical protein
MAAGTHLAAAAVAAASLVLEAERTVAPVHIASAVEALPQPIVDTVEAAAAIF